MGTISAVRRPLVVLTSNATRELSEAIKRRCLFLHIDYPDAEREREIVVSQVPEVEEQLAGQIVEVVAKLRGLELRKAPSIAETIDWARTLVALGTGTLDAAAIDRTLGVVLKHAERPRPGGPRAEAASDVTLLDRHIEFVEALRAAGLPVSLAEGLDAVRAIDALGIGERETLRAAYAATLVKRQNHRPGFDQVFDLYFPALIGDGHELSVVRGGRDERARLEITTEEAETLSRPSEPSATVPRRSPTSATP